MKRKIKKIKFYSFNKLHQNYMRDPEYKNEYEALQFDFSLIKAIIRARGKKGLTQRELAKRLKVAQSSLARLESGRANPRLSFLKKVTTGLGLKLTVV